MNVKSGVLVLILVLILSFASGCISGDSNDEFVDTDGDGVQDKYDACPTIAGEPTNQGCPTSTPAPTTQAPTTTAAPTTAAPTTAAPTTTWTSTPTYIPTFTVPPTMFTYTALPIMSLPPNFFNIIRMGHYEPTVSIKSGIIDIYIVSNEGGSVDVHVITRSVMTGNLYKGYFVGYYDDGDLVGAIDYSDREEYFTISKNADGTLSVSVEGAYDGGGVYAYSTKMGWIESVDELGNHYYIENYDGIWLNMDSSQKISSISLGVLDANTLQASVMTHCGGSYCEWKNTTATMYPGNVTFTFTNVGGDELEVEFIMGPTGAVTAQWVLAYNGGGIAGGTQSLFSFRPMAI